MPHWTWPSTAASVHPPGDIVSCFVTSYDTVWHCWVANYQIGPSHFFCKLLGNVSSCTLLLIIILLSRAVLASFWSKSEPEHIGEVQPVLIILKCICKRRQRAKQPCRSFEFWSCSPPLSTPTQCTDPMHACSASLAAQQPTRWISSLILIKSETLPQSRVSRIINDNVLSKFSWNFSQRFCLFLTSTFQRQITLYPSCWSLVGWHFLSTFILSPQKRSKDQTYIFFFSKKQVQVYQIQHSHVPHHKKTKTKTKYLKDPTWVIFLGGST